MTAPIKPHLRSLKVEPVGDKAEALFMVRDPEGLGEPKIISLGAAFVASLMDGKKTLSEIQAIFEKQFQSPLPLSDLEQIIEQFDDAHLLHGERFDAFYREAVQKYLALSTRPASHAGISYAAMPTELQNELDDYFTCEEGPGAIDLDTNGNGQRLHGIIAPHIDPYRGGKTLAWAYKEVAEACDANIFVIFGTAHRPINQWFSVTRKDFETPLGTVRTDQQFIDRLAERLSSSVAGQQIDLFADEFAHRHEHSIEFQAVFLQHVLGGRRDFRIVPILVASFTEFITNYFHPDGSPEIHAFLSELCATAKEQSSNVCYISSADLAHIGPEFGDDLPLSDQQLAKQSDDDHQLLELAKSVDGSAFFDHVAERQDRARICGLPPIYSFLQQTTQPVCGRLLSYDQAVTPNRTSCVSFGSVAFYET